MQEQQIYGGGKTKEACLSNYVFNLQRLKNGQVKTRI